MNYQPMEVSEDGNTSFSNFFFLKKNEGLLRERERERVDASVTSTEILEKSVAEQNNFVSGDPIYTLLLSAVFKETTIP